MKVERKEWVKAWTQWLTLLLSVGAGVVLTIFPMGFLVAYYAKPGTNRYGESKLEHSDRYKAEGSSGIWEYYATFMPVLKYFDNLEDGQLGEDSGKWSASRKGKERSFWSKYLWAVRNPFNYAKRTSKYFACFVNECIVSYVGDAGVTDKTPSGDGAYFVTAKDRSSGRVYYGYRRVVHWDNLKWYSALLDWLEAKGQRRLVAWMSDRVYNAVLGFKIKPEHKGQVQDEDDLDKAFTFRIQLFSKVN